MSFFKRGTETSAAKPVSAGVDDVQQLRLRARRRLMGAAVLVILGVIGFPLVFETQPRPIPVDLPVEIPRKEGAAPLTVPTAPETPAAVVAPTVAPVAASVVAASQSAGAEPKSTQGQGIITEDRDGNPVPASPARTAADANATNAPRKKADTVVAASKPAPAASKLAQKVSDKATDKASEKSTAKASPNAAESARVQAMLEGKPAAQSAAANGRVIVQVGAFAENKSAQEVRVKIEHLGLKTYTQAVETADGRRIRVRVGPFASRDEADKAATKLRAAGLTAAVLTL
ncbi:MAG: SPOR domain-containing protein [Pelomonas sp.]|nr:SPOR domain-containing protein [Burkholderiaceae bacterium]MBV8604564.1 SPOR domain-containing protein [Roseateles sp.]